MTQIKEFEVNGLRAVIVKHPTLGHLCGYLGVPAGHALHGLHYDDRGVPDDVHGGWTYSDDSAPGEKPDGRWYFGFDCAHVGDFVPGCSLSNDVGSDAKAALRGEVYRDADFVEGELRRAANALAKARGET